RHLIRMYRIPPRTSSRGSASSHTPTSVISCRGASSRATSWMYVCTAPPRIGGMGSFSEPTMAKRIRIVSHFRLFAPPYEADRLFGLRVDSQLFRAEVTIRSSKYGPVPIYIVQTGERRPRRAPPQPVPNRLFRK